MDKVTGYLDSGVPVDTVFLDFVKAFDKVPLKFGSQTGIPWNIG